MSQHEMTATAELPGEPTATEPVPVPPGMMECPSCGHEMPDLKGGKATICPRCGFKDSCCY